MSGFSVRPSESQSKSCILVSPFHTTLLLSSHTPRNRSEEAEITVSPPKVASTDYNAPTRRFALWIVWVPSAFSLLKKKKLFCGCYAVTKIIKLHSHIPFWYWKKLCMERVYKVEKQPVINLVSITTVHSCQLTFLLCIWFHKIGTLNHYNNLLSLLALCMSDVNFYVFGKGQMFHRCHSSDSLLEKQTGTCRTFFLQNHKLWPLPVLSM